MSWINLNQSLSDLKGQFKNLASEVFSEGIVEDKDPFTEISSANEKIKELRSLCASQDAEIKTLRRQNATLHQEKLNALSKNNGAQSSSSTQKQSNSSNLEANWFWDPPDEETSTNSQSTESQSLQRKILELQNEISTLKSANSNENVDFKKLQEQIDSLKEENKNLTLNLEDLDTQNQIALNKVITLKQELQKNYDELLARFQVLDKENKEFKTRLKNSDSSDGDSEELAKMNAKLVADLETLHRKYNNLEKVHRLLTENTERFQEENVDLNEENFRLQEECTKLQNDLDEVRALSQSAPIKYKELENKFFDLEKKFAEKSCPKSVDSVLDALHDTKAQEIIAQLKFEIVELQNKLNTNEEIKRLNLEIDHLKKEIEYLSNAKGASISCDSFKKVINKYATADLIGAQKPSTATEEEILHFLESCFSSLKNKNETLEIRVNESSRTINCLQKDIDELNAEIEIVNGDLAHYEHECSELKKNNDFLIAEISALKSVSKLEPILEQNEEHLAKLQGELEDCCKLNKNFKMEMDDKDNELKAVFEEKNKLRDEIAKLKRALESFREAQSEAPSAESLQGKLKNALLESEKLKSQLQAAIVDNEKNKIDLTILDNDKVLLQSEINELKANLQAKALVEEHTKSIESQNLGLESKLTNLSEMEFLVNKLNELKNTIVSLNESESNSKIIIDELIKYKDLASDGAKAFTEKEAEIESLKLETLSIEKNFNSQKEILSLLNNKITEQFKRLYDSFGIEIDDVEEFSSVNAIDAAFEKIEAFISILDGKKRDLLNEIKEQYEKFNETSEEKRILSDDMHNKEKEISELKLLFDNLQAEVIGKNSKNAELLERINKKDIEISRLKDEFNLLLTKEKSDETESGQLIELINKQDEELHIVKSEKEKLIQDMGTHHDTLTKELESSKKAFADVELEISAKNEQIKSLTDSLACCQKERNEIAFKLNKFAEESANTVSSDELTKLNAELLELTMEKEKQNAELEQFKNENVGLKSTVATLEKQCEENIVRIKEFECTNREILTQLDQLNTEKSELINLVTQKHHESVTYHNEIQKLNGILLTENERYKELERIYAAAVDHKSSGNQATSDEINRLNETLREKNNKCVELERQINELSNSGVTAEDLEKLRDKNQFLIEKCDVLGKNLVMEQANLRQVAQEKMQILEREQSMTRELERLRQHLVEMEDEHTRELVSAEQKLQEAQMKLSQAEDKVKQSSTLYTSNSIRANQEVETLRTQIKLVEKQRDEIQFQLSQSEDRNSKNLAALTNLQCVLEQFQMDKEREGEAIAGRARRDLESAREEITRLLKQISDMEEKLRESSTGLRAATRLSAQLDAKSAQVHEAKEQVTKLEEELGQWKKKYKDTVSNQQDKIDKSLVKNLLIGYIQTASNQKPKDRIQVLRLLSTVLDFDKLECDRVGLGSKSSVTGALNSDSLAQEFIKFLEKESRPQLKVGLPNLLHLGNPQGPTTPPHITRTDSPHSVSSRASDSPHQQATPSPQQSVTTKQLPVVPMTISNPLLSSASVSPVTVISGNQDGNQTANYNPIGQNSGFNNSMTGGFSLFTPIANPDIVVNQTRNNEGAILKNVLKDS